MLLWDREIDLMACFDYSRYSIVYTLGIILLLQGKWQELIYHSFKAFFIKNITACSRHDKLFIK